MAYLFGGAPGSHSGAHAAPPNLPDPDALALSNALELDAIRTVVLREAHVGRLSQLCFKYAAATAAVKQAAKLPRHRRELQRVLDSLVRTDCECACSNKVVHL